MGEPEPGARIAVIVPTLNEIENIDALLTAVLAQASDERHLEVLVVAAARPRPVFGSRPLLGGG